MRYNTTDYHLLRLKGLKKYLIAFLVSMLPIVELRGGIPAAYAGGIEWYWAYILCCLGNLLPIPFILLFIDKVIKWMVTSKHFSKIGRWLEKKAAKNTSKVQKYEFFGLMLFVAIPLPMTGAWTGALVAGVTKMKFWNAILSILLGVLIAGAIVTLICTGVLAGLNFLL